MTSGRPHHHTQSESTGNYGRGGLPFGGKRQGELLAPERRISRKSTLVEAAPEQAPPAEAPVPPLEHEGQGAAPTAESRTALTSPEPVLGDPSTPCLVPEDEGVESAEADLKREFGPASGEWEELDEQPSKRARLQLLELLHLKIQEQQKPAMRKRAESSMAEFTGRDLERLHRAIQKEINNNLATQAYEFISPEEARVIRRTKSDKIVRSRFVLTKKPLESHAIEAAQAADEVLDHSDGIPCKAKARHVMMGFSEPGILDLETTTPQVHRDSVIFATQVIVSNQWQCGMMDFTQAFHSGDKIQRELYAEIPKDMPNVAPGSMLRLKKTCYGLTDGPYAWYMHITRVLTKDLGYRQSIIDPCLFFLDSEDDGEPVEGIIALATDDMLHGGGPRHHALLDKIREKYKLGKDVFGGGRFVGKNLAPQPDGSMLIEQSFYVDEKVKPIEISRERKRKRFVLYAFRGGAAAGTRGYLGLVS